MILEAKDNERLKGQGFSMKLTFQWGEVDNNIQNQMQCPESNKDSIENKVMGHMGGSVG